MREPVSLPDLLLKMLPATGTRLAWGAAVLVLVIAILLKVLLDWIAGDPIAPFVTLYPAVMIAGLAAGPRAGILAALMSALLAGVLWLRPHDDLHQFSIVVALTVFAVCGVFVGWFAGVARIALERAQTAERGRQRAAREAVHRLKNLLTVLQAIREKVARETSTVVEFSEVLRQRLHAMAVAQDVLVRTDWQEADLQQLIDACLAPFLANPRLHLKPGPKALVTSACVSGLSLALHELCTNSMKYGALALGEGRVDLSWEVEAGETRLLWREAPGRAEEITPGFGTQLIRAGLAQESGSRVEYEIAPVLIRADFCWRLPPDKIHMSAKSESAARAA